ncbi:MAG: Nucleoside-diphosphate-sugar epimerases [uncultured Chloroflexia bacterium]|uniref:Nucleoside-diphosphate-sugar epimerases n=1 Tax=uncultured Chloroflexia bacterium TaxID=1672391 RepID=A0A6J4MI62_9CHLR|nr:MAG: Nucleoside-diphosphate-sugar epimerases [uncultured Chloroflexia bacterium]
MRVFVTGATGFIGSAVVRELLAAGHTVLGLARSEQSAASLEAAGAEVQRGTLEDLDSLQSAAATTDGVIHTAFVHDFSDYARAAETDRRAIEALGDVLAGSNRPLVVASGVAGIAQGHPATEDDEAPTSLVRLSEPAALALVARDIRASVIRLPPTVHGAGDHGFIPQIITVAREKGASAYPNDGTNRWSAVHRLDAARLFRIALERAPASTRLHAVADESVAVRDIASVIGRHLELPVVAVASDDIAAHFGWIGTFFSRECGATSTLTQQRFGWHPGGPDLLNDLEQGHYFNEE